MRRLTISALVAALGLLVLAPAALGAKPSTGCPSENSGWFVVDKDGWWHHTVLGFEAEGIDVYDGEGNFTTEFDEFAASVGFADGADLEFFVRFTQWDAFNHNGDDYVCMKYWPDTPGNPAYLFGGVDNQSSSKKGQPTP